MPILSAALRPNTMPLSICWVTIAGLTTWPQSTAQTTRCTLTLPLVTRNLGNLRVEAAQVVDDGTPRNRPAGSGLPQPDLSAARFSTFR